MDRLPIKIVIKTHSLFLSFVVITGSLTIYNQIPKYQINSKMCVIAILTQNSNIIELHRNPHLLIRFLNLCTLIEKVYQLNKIDVALVDRASCLLLLPLNSYHPRCTYSCNQWHILTLNCKQFKVYQWLAVERVTMIIKNRPLIQSQNKHALMFNMIIQKILRNLNAKYKSVLMTP